MANKTIAVFTASHTSFNASGIFSNRLIFPLILPLQRLFHHFHKPTTSNPTKENVRQIYIHVQAISAHFTKGFC